MAEKIKTCITKMTINAPTYSNVSFSPTMINFLYGKNGTGKSSLARSFKDGCAKMEWKGSPLSNEQVFIYNEEFIQKNIQSYGNIPGVFTISEVNAETKKEIDVKTSERGNLNSQLNAAEAENDRLITTHAKAEESYYASLWSKTEEFRKAFPVTQKGFAKDKRKFGQHLGETVPADIEKEDCKELYETVFGDEQPRYDQYRLISLDNLSANELMKTKIESRANTEFARLIRNLGNLDWVTEGHNLYHNGSKGKCPYCQQALPSNFEEQLSACYDAQYKKDLSDLHTFANSYTQKMREVESIIERNNQNPYPSKLTDVYKAQSKVVISSIKNNYRLLEIKQGKPSESLELEDLIPTIEELNSIANKINNEIKEYMEVVNDIPKQQNKCTEMVWGMMAKHCTSILKDWKTTTEKYNEDCKKNQNTINTLRSSISTLDAEITQLNSQTANTEEAKTAINNAIKNAGFKGFSLREKPGAKYVYELIRDRNGRVEVVNQNLSEGERNFIAFLYFYHLVMGTQSEKGKQEDKIVVIDDPVSSMDSSSLFIVASLIRELISVCYNNYEMDNERSDKHIRQFFCMTHNPYFFREITYNRISDYECASFFLITKDNDNKTSIEPCEEEDGLPGNGKVNCSPVRNTYESYWRTYSREKDPETLIMVMRQILEYYFIQMVGYKSGSLRKVLLDKNKKEFIHILPDGSEDRSDYVAASAMIAMLEINARDFNDGLYYDSSAVDADQLKRVFERIFKVLGQQQHFDMMTRRA